MSLSTKVDEVGGAKHEFSATSSNFFDMQVFTWINAARKDFKIALSFGGFYPPPPPLPTVYLGRHSPSSSWTLPSILHTVSDKKNWMMGRPRDKASIVIKPVHYC